MSQVTHVSPRRHDTRAPCWRRRWVCRLKGVTLLPVLVLQLFCGPATSQNRKLKEKGKPQHQKPPRPPRPSPARVAPKPHAAIIRVGFGLALPLKHGPVGAGSCVKFTVHGFSWNPSCIRHRHGRFRRFHRQLTHPPRASANPDLLPVPGTRPAPGTALKRKHTTRGLL